MSPTTTLRKWLQWPLAALCLWTVSLPVAARADAAPDNSTSCPPLAVNMQPVAPGVWLKPAQPGAASGWTEPTVVWADPRHVWVLDPGPHRCAGLALRQWLTRHVPGRSVQIINSHAHPENVLANSAWPRGTPIHALAGTREQMSRRCPTCLKYMQQTLGPRWMRGTRVVLPNRELAPGQWLTLAGQRWQVQAHTPAHTEADLSLWQPDTRTWLAAGLVAWSGLPETTRGRVQPWLQALATRLPAQPADTATASAHAAVIWGAPSSSARLPSSGNKETARQESDMPNGLNQAHQTQRYLAELDGLIERSQAAGLSVLEVLAQPPGPAFQPWLTSPLAIERHQRNLMHEWQLREDDSFN